jgi:ABC-type thiamine transport system substrate-binding protein
MIRAYSDIVDFIAREKTSELTAQERSELDHYLQIEHIMRLAKAKARKLVSG